jgi:hypothetical protein
MAYARRMPQPLTPVFAGLKAHSKPRLLPVQGSKPIPRRDHRSPIVLIVVSTRRPPGTIDGCRCKGQTAEGCKQRGSAMHTLGLS